LFEKADETVISMERKVRENEENRKKVNEIKIMKDA
jgi:hypothetical protein